MGLIFQIGGAWSLVWLWCSLFDHVGVVLNMKAILLFEDAQWLLLDVPRGWESKLANGRAIWLRCANLAQKSNILQTAALPRHKKCTEVHSVLLCTVLLVAQISAVMSSKLHIRLVSVQLKWNFIMCSINLSAELMKGTHAHVLKSTRVKLFFSSAYLVMFARRDGNWTDFASFPVRTD